MTSEITDRQAQLIVARALAAQMNPREVMELAKRAKAENLGLTGFIELAIETINSNYGTDFDTL